MSLLQDLHRRFSKKTLPSDLPAAARRKAQQERQASGQKEWREAYAATSKEERDARISQWKDLSSGLLPHRDRKEAEKKLRALTSKQDRLIYLFLSSLVVGAAGGLITLAGVFIPYASALLVPGLAAISFCGLGIVSVRYGGRHLMQRMQAPSKILREHDYAKKNIENHLLKTAENDFGLNVAELKYGCPTAKSVFEKDEKKKATRDCLYARFLKHAESGRQFSTMDPKTVAHLARTAVNLRVGRTKDPLNFHAAMALLVSEAGMNPKEASRALRRFKKRLSFENV